MKGLFYTFTVCLLFVSTFVQAQQKKTTATQRPKLPIEYVAEFNESNSFSHSFASSHANNKCALVEGTRIPSEKWKEDGYHVPQLEEWGCVFPVDRTIDFKKKETVTNHGEYAMIAGEVLFFRADYKRSGDAFYAIRFKNKTNKLRCAYRYQKTGTFENDGNLDSGLEVSVIYLGPSFKGTINTIANEAYWNTNKNKIVKRYFPAAGFGDFNRGAAEDVIRRRGYAGYYWALHDFSYAGIPAISFNERFVQEEIVNRQKGACLRLFSDK